MPPVFLPSGQRVHPSAERHRQTRIQHCGDILLCWLRSEPVVRPCTAAREHLGDVLHRTECPGEEHALDCVLVSKPFVVLINN